MSRPRFLADEDFRFEIVLAVRRAEPAIDIITVQEAGLSSVNDSRVLERANSDGFVVVSHDVNTMRAHAEKRILDGIEMAGLLLAPQSKSTRDIANSLILIWAASEAEEWRNSVAFIPL